MTAAVSSDVLIVGAGIAGLACARHLQAAGLTATLLESEDATGGRVRTDRVSGPGGTYRLDRGFQVYLPAYPEAAGLLDLPTLHLRPFVRGALIRMGGRWARLSDPRSDTPLAHRLATAFSPAMTWTDRLWAARHLLPLIRSGPVDPTTGTAREWLTRCGFSRRMVRRFWEPFLGGVLLDRSLSAPADFVRFTLRMFAEGGAALPAQGIGEIPRQLAAGLPPERLRLRTRVVDAGPGVVRTADGQTLTARATVIAADAATARQLLPGTPITRITRSTACLYFAADRPPLAEPILLLDGDGEGPINHAAVLTTVTLELAPPGKALISLSTVPLTWEPWEAVVAAARRQMAGWFGEDVRGWQFLRGYRIPEALPAVTVPRPSSEIVPGLYLAGDHTQAPSLNGAMASGRLAAAAVRAYLRG